MKRVVVLGGGISGLVAAYRLCDRFDVTLIEQSDRLGGCLLSEQQGDFFFEKGPRTFKPSTSHSLLALAKELKLPLVYAKTHKRYLYMQKKLHAFPSLFSSVTLKALVPLFKESHIPVGSEEDETIEAFVQRRFGPYIARTFFDPLSIGIYAGDFKKLSMRSCFPSLFRLEKEEGSILKGMMKKKSGEKIPLYTFEGGVRCLTEALANKVKSVLNERVISLGQGYVSTDRNHYEADLIISALPSFSLESIIKEAHLKQQLLNIPYQDLTVVNVGYSQDNLVKPAFGYLIPSFEKETILGVVFDSQIFGEGKQTRLTVMISGCEKKENEYEWIALDALKRHLGIALAPEIIMVTRWQRAIPQFFVGYHRFLEQFKRDIHPLYPNLHLIGSWIGGVSVSDCVATAEALSQKLVQEHCAQHQLL